MHIRLTRCGSPSTAGTAQRVIRSLVPSSGAAAVGPSLLTTHVRNDSPHRKLLAVSRSGTLDSSVCRWVRRQQRHSANHGWLVGRARF